MQTSDIVVIDPCCDGGICHYTFALSNALAARGQKVSLVTSRAPYELAQLPRRFERVPLLHHPYQGRETLGQRLIRRASPEAANRRYGAQVGAFLKNAKPRVVHQQWLNDLPTEPMFWDAMQRRAGRPLPLIYTAHNVFPHEATLEVQRAYRKVYERPQRIIVHGETLRAAAIEEAQVAPEKLRVLPHGHYHFLADAFPVPSKAEARALLELDSNDRVILFFGFVRTYKGLDILLLALERLLREPSSGKIKLLMAGALPDRQKWASSLYGGLARGLKVQDSVRVHDAYIALSEMGRYFAAADVVAFPYREGSQSGALQLAYAFERPVVATCVGSLPEAVEPRETGLLVPPEEPELLAQSLRDLLDDPALAARMGKRGREWSGDVCSWDKIAARTLEIYDDSDEAGGSPSSQKARAA